MFVIIVSIGSNLNSGGSSVLNLKLFTG